MPTVFLAQEDDEAREIFSSLILDFFPTANLRPISNWEEIEPALGTPPPSSVLLADILWGHQDRSAELLLLAEKVPEISFAVFGRFELTGSLPAGYPIPLLAPDDALPLRLAEIMENLAGREFGPYVISCPAGPHALGRLYWAKHHQLQRSVQLLVPPSGSEVFPKAIRALARVNHPSVYSLYESVPWGNRIVVAQEPVINPSLLHLRISGDRVGLLSGARLATTLGSVLAEMESSSVLARLLGEYDYTLSPKGIPRLRNPAAYPGQPGVSSQENAQHLGQMLEPMLAGQPKAAPLLQILRNPGPSAVDLLLQTREFERQLADVREVRIRKEEREAEQKMLRARHVRRWAIAIGSALTAAFLVIYARVIFQRFILDVPAQLAEAELPVPAGMIFRDGETVPVPAFFLDRHEVTIGDYEKFLLAARNDPGWQRWVPEEARPRKATVASLEPRDWTGILDRARKNEKYQEQTISRDTPVFNVDYFSAAAYAKWKGRRLPTMEEWMRAAGAGGRQESSENQTTPPARANFGTSRDESTGRDAGDGYFNAAPAESFPEDRGPFGHLDLGGNVSEWAVGPFQRPVALGANFTDPGPIPPQRARRQDANRNDPSPQSQLEMIGFRTAR